MHLKILLPTEIFFNQRVTKITAEAENGLFCILPRHRDFVTALVPGIVSIDSETDKTIYAALDQGVLIKCMDEVSIATRNAVMGPDLGHLQQTVEKEFINLNEKERTARSAVARLEAGFIRQFLNIEH